MTEQEQAAPRAPRKTRTRKPSNYYNLEAGRDRDQDESIHEDDYGDFWETQRNLPMPEPRPGFVQRWVRVAIDGRADSKNIRNKNLRGYLPRPPGSVTGMPISKLGDDDVIGDEDNVLMERPKWIEEKERAAARERAKDQMREVQRNVFKAGRDGGDSFGGIQYAEDKSSVRTGRPAPIDDDPAFG